MHLVSSGNLCLFVKNPKCPVTSTTPLPPSREGRGAPALRKGVKALEPGTSGSILTIYQPGDLGQVFQRKGQILIFRGGVIVCKNRLDNFLRKQPPVRSPPQSSSGGWNAENLQERAAWGLLEPRPQGAKAPSTPSCPAPHSRLPGKSSILTRLAGTGASSPPPPRLSARPMPGPLRRELREVVGSQVRCAVAAGHLGMGGRKARASRGARSPAPSPAPALGLA